jgi:hypothetical protein
MGHIHEGQLQATTDLPLLSLVNRQLTNTQSQYQHNSNLTCVSTLFSVATS